MMHEKSQLSRDKFEKSGRKKDQISTRIDKVLAQYKGTKRRKHFIKSVFLFSVRLGIFWIVMLAAAGVTTLFFYLSHKSVVVPELVGQELTEAMLELQKRNLRTEIAEQFSSNPDDRGRVLSQDPQSGINVREQRTVTLTVSKGRTATRVPNLVGSLFNDVSQNVGNAFPGFNQHFNISFINKIFDESPPGTILGQYPAPDTSYQTALAEIQIEVSRGNLLMKNIIPDMLGLDFTAIFPIIEKYSPDFSFFFVNNDNVVLDTEKKANILSSGIIMEQVPVPGDAMDEGQILYVGLRRNMIDIHGTGVEEESEQVVKRKKTGILKIDLTEYAEKHTITIYRSFDSRFSQKGSEEAEIREDETETKYLEFTSNGGRVTIPYYIKRGYRYSIHRFGNEVWSYTITRE